MTDLDELVGRLKTPCFERGLDEGWIDKEREQAATAITTLEAEVRKQAMDYLVLSGQADEALAKVVTLEAELAAAKARGDGLAEALSAEPTEAMVEAGIRAISWSRNDRNQVTDIYRAMLAANQHHGGNDADT